MNTECGIVDGQIATARIKKKNGPTQIGIENKRREKIERERQRDRV